MVNVEAQHRKESRLPSKKCPCEATGPIPFCLSAYRSARWSKSAFSACSSRSTASSSAALSASIRSASSCQRRISSSFRLLSSSVRCLASSTSKALSAFLLRARCREAFTPAMSSALTDVVDGNDETGKAELLSAVLWRLLPESFVVFLSEDGFSVGPSLFSFLLNSIIVGSVG